MKKFLFVLTMFINASISAQDKTVWPESLVLTPERSAFEKTSTYADMMQFTNSIKTMSPCIKVASLGKSPAGKDIPLIILSKKGISTPAEAKASGKPVIYVQGNIHGGEVEGKEVVMMLMRDILLGKLGYLLDNQVILFVPMYNTDGNDKMAKGLRPTQENSPLETGERENGQGLDLNRDGIKMEAPETHGLMEVISSWDPQVSVDLHTTNGTWHAFSLTWAPSYLYAGEPATSKYTNDVMLASITAKSKEKYGLLIGPYGDYNMREGWPVKNFYTYNHHPRYIINQFSLRNRMAILSESFAHERFYQRIHSTYAFTFEILDYCNRHGKEIMKINHDAETAAVRNVLENAGKAKKGVRFKMVPAKKKLNHFPTYDYNSFTKSDGTTTLLRTGRVVHYDSITYFGEFKDTVQSTVPRGYIIPAAFAQVAEVLKSHGAKVQVMDNDETFSGEVFTIDKFIRAPRKFEGHLMASAEGKFEPATRSFHKGDFRVDMAQPLTNLIFYMLEPQSDDGLLVWNFFDSYLDDKQVSAHPVEYPIFKYFPAPTNNKSRK